jgi:hypothetical protein
MFLEEPPFMWSHNIFDIVNN